MRPIRAGNTRLAVASLFLVGQLSACDSGPQPPTVPDAPATAVTVHGTVADPDGAPVGDAVVTATAQTVMVTRSDATGAFAAGPVNAVIGSTILVTATRDGFHTQALAVKANAPDVSATIRLLRMTGSPLPIDGRLAGTLLPTDPAGWVGEIYDSDFTFNTQHIPFLIPDSIDLIVDLAAEPVANAQLKLWALDGTLKSTRAAGIESIRLPHGANGILTVGQDYGGGRLTEPVPFVLTTRSAPPQ